MRLTELETINAMATAALRQGRPSDSPYFGYVEIGFLPGSPFLMFTNNDCAVTGEILRSGVFEPGSLRLWVDLCASATSALDIGAYTGIYALAAASARPDLAVHAFEPNPFNAARLRVNRTVNRLQNLHEHSRAVVAQAGVAKVRWNRKTTGALSSVSTVAEMKADASQIEVALAEAGPLDAPAFVQSLGPRPLIKIDVEGAEASVFGGLDSVLALRPDIILETFSEEACTKIARKLAPFAYEYHLIVEETGTLMPQPTLRPADPKQPDRNQYLRPKRV